MEISQNNATLPAIFALVIIIGMQIGINYSETNRGKFPISQKEEVSKLENILSKINAKYVDTVNIKNLSLAAIRGIFSALDPHSTYISRNELKTITEDMEGRFEGIGIEFFMVDDTIMVINTITNGPSEKVGLQSGDRIIRIEDRNVAGDSITTNEVMKLLKGPKGTKVTIFVMRSGEPDLLEFTISRGKIPLFSVDASFMVNEHVGYIRINRFSETSYNEFVSAIKRLQKENMAKLILDLRDNPGGYLNAAIKIADEFLDEGKMIVYTQGKAYQKQEYYSTNRGIFKDGEVILLINEFSASASEILAGAFQDWGRGMIFGRRSFGKGLVQEQIILPDSSAIRLTVSRYFTPSGRCIQKPYKNGITAYNQDLYNRYNRGEFESVDSIKFDDSLKYVTPEGKVVFGGGGIMPDYFIPLDTNYHSGLLKNINRKNLIPGFAYGYYARNIRFFKSFDNMNSFNEEYKTSGNIMKKFIQYIETKGVRVNNEEWNRSKDKIALQIKAFIGRALYDNEVYYSIVNSNDPVFLSALKKIKHNM